LKKVVYAGSQEPSFSKGAESLEVLAETKITTKRVERWTKRIGNERVAEVDSAAESERRQSPRDQVPQVAVVQPDGGRIQIRDRSESSEDKKAKGYWRESLGGCLLSMVSKESSKDPCPIIPKTFVDPERTRNQGVCE